MDSSNDHQSSSEERHSLTGAKSRVACETTKMKMSELTRMFNKMLARICIGYMHICTILTHKTFSNYTRCATVIITVGYTAVLVLAFSICCTSTMIEDKKKCAFVIWLRMLEELKLYGMAVCDNDTNTNIKMSHRIYTIMIMSRLCVFSI